MHLTDPARDIAVTGIGCRFPGAPDHHAYWRLLLGAERQFTAVPGERWDHRPFHAPGDRSAPDAAYTDRVAFLDGVDRFAALHYGLPPRRAEAMDPQHRLMLDVAREALDDAGLGRGGFDRETTGVFVALSVSDHKDLMTARIRALELLDDTDTARDPALARALRAHIERRTGPLNAFTLPGSLLNMAPAAISRHFDLGGPSFAVDAACSGSLIALDQAVHQLRAGACSTAVVGGAHISLTPDSLIGFSRLGALSAEGVCRPFDERADGFVLGEGAGALVLRRLADALSAGDRIYAVIKGTGAANDGAGPGPLTPTPEGQLRAMRRAYADAGLPPGSVGFLEAHGTGTTVGDRVEIEALRLLRGEHPAPCWLSSGKALIGHALAAAGIAGLIKTALVVHHRTVVPQPHTVPHPRLELDAAGLRLADTARPWPDGDTPRRAAVSSFGFGGTDVHVVLEQAPAPARPPRTRPAAKARTRPVARPQLVLVTAGSPALLRDHIDDLLRTLEAAPAPSVAALAHTLGGRAPLPSRLAVVATDPAALTERLRRARRQLADGERGDLGDDAWAADEPLPPHARRIAFVHPGQGSQRPGMLHDLYDRFPAFRRTLEVLGAAAGRDVTDLVYGVGDPERLTPTEVCQPVLGALQIAADRVLAGCGVRPGILLGHSVGEFAAATTAGFLDAEETVRLLAHRGRALRDAEAGLYGGMLAVQADEDTCRRLLDGLADVWPACFNQPLQTVVSGGREGLDALRRVCAEAGVATLPLMVSNAFHTPRLAGADEAMRTDLAGRSLTAPRLPFVSAVSGAPCSDPEELRALWARHASSPVRFADAVRAAHDAGARIFLQVSGGGSLLTSVRRTLDGHDGVHVVPVDGPAPDDPPGLPRALARLAVLGVPVDPRALVEEADRRVLDLPPARLDARPCWTRREAPTTPAPAPAPASAPAAPALPAPRAVPDLAPDLAPEPDSAPVPDPEPSKIPVRELLDVLHRQTTLLHRIAETLCGVVTGTGAEPPPGGAPADGAERAVPAVQAVRPDLDASAVRAEPAAPSECTDPVARVVREEIARVGAFPPDHVRADHSLVDDLGFDSLMLTDLFTALKRRWPTLTVDERSARPTVAEVTALVPPDAASATGPAPATATDDRRAPEPPVPSPAPAALYERSAPPAVEHLRVDDFPEVAAHRARKALLDELRLPNPYLMVHDSGLTDRTVVDGRELISFSGFNYLGLATHPKVRAAAQEAVERYGTSASASRLLSGSRPLHLELERELARHLGTEDALTLTSGHATNVTVIGHLVGPEDLIVYDALAHDSILQGCRLSGATRRPFPHDDAAALDALLGRVRDGYRRVLIVVEGVYSMDGDIADLPALVAVKRRHGALLMVDEAHSIGVLGENGRGVGEHCGVERADVDVWMGTLSKALAGCGGYAAASRAVVDWLRYTAPGFVYSTGMTPADTAAALAALRLLREEPRRLVRLRENAELFLRLARRAGVDTGGSGGTPVVPCVVGDSARTLRLAQGMFRRGISVNPILHPAVPEELARLRFFVTAAHTPEQLRSTVAALRLEMTDLDAAGAGGTGLESAA
ncbi:type I polyketide synthase [Streptomyces sp. NPDC057386]|uniref:type I polyketide synthase n=1 Tax=unclassified Streptomyces TaxID=2593676 RepID=UPI00363761A0